MGDPSETIAVGWLTDWEGGRKGDDVPDELGVAGIGRFERVKYTTFANEPPT